MSSLKKLKINKETMRILTRSEGDQVGGGTTGGPCAASVVIVSGVTSNFVYSYVIGCQQTPNCVTTQCGGGGGGTGSGTVGSIGGTYYCVSGSGPGSGPPPPPPPITTQYGDGTVCY